MRHAHKIRLLLPLFLLSLLLLVALPLKSAAQSKSVDWRRIDVDITVSQDGTFTVVETLEIEFVGGPFRFGYRNIPRDRLTAIDKVRVWDEQGEYTALQGKVTDGKPRSFSVYVSGNDYVIRWFFEPTSNTVRTFRVAYRVQGGLRYYQEGDQLWWAAVFPDRSGPVRRSTVTVTVPGPIQNAAAYFVPANVEQINDRTVRFKAKTQIPAGTAFEVRVQWPHGIVAGTPAPWQAAADAEAAREERMRIWNQKWRPLANLFLLAISLLLLSLGIAGIYLLWYARGRDMPAQVFAEYLPEPPSDLPPALAGTLVDERADMKEILATVVDLARRGVLEIEEVKEGWRGTDFRFRLKSSRLSNLEPFEQEVVKGLLGTRRERFLSDLKNKFYRHIPRIRRAIYEAVTERGYFPTNPEKVRTRYALLGAGVDVLGGLLTVGGWMVLSDWVDLAFLPGASLFVLGAIMMVVANFMPRKTAKGAEEAAKWKAFRTYLERLQKLPDTGKAQEILERYLPYAIAFGVEDSFLKRFEAVAAERGEVVYWPTWYHPYPSPASGRSPGHASIPGSGGSGPPSLGDASRSIGSGLSGLSRSLGTMLATATTTAEASTSRTGGRAGHDGGRGGEHGAQTATEAA